MRRALRLGGLIALSNPGNLISSEAGKIEEKRKQDWPAHVTLALTSPLYCILYCRTISHQYDGISVLSGISWRDER